MPRVNYREIAERFTHIDADFVASEIGMPGNDGFFTVDIYPWWEHPLYREARATGTNWGFYATDDAYRPVTVYPKQIYQVRLTQMSAVKDWDFTQEHPLLWQYERSGKITCNSPVSLDQWMQISGDILRKFTGYNRQVELSEYVSLQTIYRWGGSGSFALGDFPRPLFIAVRQALDEQGVRYFAGRDPESVELPVLFLIDGDDYIIAKDFEVDVPEFEHRPEWFQPR